MKCEELRPDYVLFAMGVLDDPEESELRAHLDRGCDACTSGMKDARAWVYALGASNEGPEPPKRLRKRILASAGAIPESRWHWRTAWQAAAAVALVAVAIIVYLGQRQNAERAELRAQLNRTGMEAVRLREALAVLQAPETKEVTFGGAQPTPPRGRVFVNPSGVLLIATNLPAPPPGKTYEMWIIPKAGSPAPAGLFSSSQEGTAVHLFRTPVSVASTGLIAVTLEPAGGVSAPTSQPVIAAAL